MHPTRQLLSVLSVLSVALLAGCSGLKAPRVTVTSIRVQETGDRAVQLAYSITLENPNDDALELELFRYSVDVDGRQVYVGRRAAETTIRPGGTRTVEIPVVISHEPLDARRRVRLRGTLGYRARGPLELLLGDLSWRHPKVSFRHEVDVQ